MFFARADLAPNRSRRPGGMAGRQPQFVITLKANLMNLIVRRGRTIAINYCTTWHSHDFTKLGSTESTIGTPNLIRTLKFYQLASAYFTRCRCLHSTQGYHSPPRGEPLKRRVPREVQLNAHDRPLIRPREGSAMVLNAAGVKSRSFPTQSPQRSVTVAWTVLPSTTQRRFRTLCSATRGRVPTNRGRTHR